jgi:hypothetical protein
MRNRYLYFTLLSVIAFNTESAAQSVAPTPRLVVNIQVEQLRTDLLEDYLPAFANDGLRKLLSAGLVYTNASFDFKPVDRASATASIATGSCPFYHGITATEWLDRSTLRPQNILADKEYKLSAASIAVSTLGDELKVATGGLGKVYAFAPSAESAILSAGHAADGAAWIQEGTWASTPYYTKQNSWLAHFCNEYIPDTDINMSVVKAALYCMTESAMGEDDNPDMLCMTLTAQPGLDGYLSLDQAIGSILGGIGSQLPSERVLFVLTGTGTTEEEENKKSSDNERFRIPTGKFNVNRTADLLNMYLGGLYGAAAYVETSFRNQLFLNHKLLEKKNLNLSEVLGHSQEFLLQLSGVRNVYTSLQLLTSESRHVEQIRNGFNIDRCGDILIDILPGWQIIDVHAHTTFTSRIGTVPFPIIFYAPHIPQQHVTTAVTADHIAPTVARAIRIRAPNACAVEALF